MTVLAEIPVGVGDDGMRVGWEGGGWLILGVEAVSVPGPWARPSPGRRCGAFRFAPRSRSGSEMTDVWEPNPWVAAFTGTTMRGAPSPT